MTSMPLRAQMPGPDKPGSKPTTRTPDRDRPAPAPDRPGSKTTRMPAPDRPGPKPAQPIKK